MRRLASSVVFLSLGVLAVYAAIDIGGRIPGPVGSALAGPSADHAPAFVPEAMSYQGRLLDSATGNPLPDGGHAVTFTLHGHPVDADPVWTEALNVTTTDGVFSVILGTITPMSSNLFSGAEGPYLELNVEGEVLTPRQQFSTVAYAFFSQGAALANNAENLDGADSTAFIRTTGVQSKSGNLTLLNDLIVEGQTTVGALSATGNTTLGNAGSDIHTVNGAMNLANNLAVNGTASLNGNNTIGNSGTDLHTVNGNLTLANNATVTGTTALNGNTTVGDAGTDAHAVNGNLTLNNLLLLNGNATIGNAVGDAHTINGNTTFNSNAIFTTGANTLGNDAADLTTLNGNLRLTTGDIENGGAFEIRINPSSATGAVVVGGSTSQSDDLEIEDGGLCVARDNCDNLPADGHIAAEAGACVGANACASAPTTGSINADGNLVLGWGEGTQAAAVAFAPGGVVSGAMTYLQADARFSFNTDVVTSDGGLCVDDGIAPVCPALTDGTILAEGAITANAFDLAERFSADTTDLQPGELVTIGDGAHVGRSDGTPYDARVAGIVSGDPGLILGWETDDSVAVALQGRVPLKVTLENGPIAPGDYLTSSSTPGHAMKATEVGPAVGIALESFDGADGSPGEVLTFLQTGEAGSAAAIMELERRIAELERPSTTQIPATTKVESVTHDGGAGAGTIVGSLSGMVLVLVVLVTASTLVGRRGTRAGS